MPVAPRIRAIAEAALDRARRDGDIEYAEVRWVDERNERLRIRDGAPDGISEFSSSGFGVRVLAHGAWGFACTPLADESAVVRALAAAVAIARASARIAKARVAFPPAEPQRGRYATPLGVEPFAVPFEQKLADLAAAESELRRGGAPIRSTEAWMAWTEVEKLLLTSEGTDVEQRFVYGGAGMQAIAVGDDGSMQRRSFPGTPGTEPVQGGYESVTSAHLVDHAPRIRDEAIALLSAPPCPPGARDVILASSQMALQIHESCGHPTELDRALGSEVSLAGGSFCSPSCSENCATARRSSL